MTPRLKILLVLFGISVLILIADRLSTSTNKPTSSNMRIQKKNKVPKERMKKVLKNSYSTKTPAVQSGDFQPLTADVLSLKGWGRNPFEKRASKTPSQSNGSKQFQKSDSGGLANLDNLSIESVYKMGGDAVVVIDGKAFRIGQTVNNMYIEKIESREITFRSGKKSYVVKVGS